MVSNSELSSSLEELLEAYGYKSGWVEARKSCDHLASLSSDLRHVPDCDSLCCRCGDPSENWLCLSCKDVFCSRFINKHMFEHHQNTGHCLALSYCDLSVWCFACDEYLDVQFIQQLQPVYEAVHLFKFGQKPPFKSINSDEGSSSNT